VFITTRVIIEFISLFIALNFVKPIINFKSIKIQKSILTKSAPYTVSEVITVVHNQSDNNLVSLFTNNLNLISYFSVAINLVNAVFAIIMTLQNVFIPTLSRIFDTQSNKIRKSIILTLLGFTAIGLVLWLGVAIFGEKIIEITMGKEYFLSSIYIEKISPIFLIRSLILGVTIILISINLQKLRIFPQAISAVFKIVLGTIVLKQFNIDGFLWIYMFSEIIMLIGLIGLLLNWTHKNKYQENISPKI